MLKISNLHLQTALSLYFTPTQTLPGETSSPYPPHLKGAESLFPHIHNVWNGYIPHPQIAKSLYHLQGVKSCHPHIF